jgi:hypothetical protein
MEIASAILALNPRQRVVLILTSEVYQSIPKKSAEKAKSSIAILQKPIAVHIAIDIIELKEVYSEIEKMHVDTDAIRRASFRHEQILNFLDSVRSAKSARPPFG